MKRILTGFLAVLLISFALTTLTSCKKDKTDDEKITIYVSPAATFIDATPGEYKNFSIVGSSPSKLSRLKITYKKEGGALSTLLDTTLETKKISFSFPFQIPTYGTQNIYLNLYFELTDVEGETALAAKGLNVLFANYPLTQTVDNELYSRSSGQPSAYNLRSASSLIYTNAWTEDMNISDTLQADTLSHSWISPGGGQFVRKNSFDFANASLTDLRNAYEASAKTNKISNLTTGDIILFKQTYGIEVFYAAIKVTGVQNNPGSSNDKYIFDIKK